MLNSTTTSLCLNNILRKSEPDLVDGTASMQVFSLITGNYVKNRGLFTSALYSPILIFIE